MTRGKKLVRLCKKWFNKEVEQEPQPQEELINPYSRDYLYKRACNETKISIRYEILNAAINGKTMCEHQRDPAFDYGSYMRIAKEIAEKGNLGFDTCGDSVRFFWSPDREKMSVID